MMTRVGCKVSPSSSNRGVLYLLCMATQLIYATHYARCARYVLFRVGPRHRCTCTQFCCYGIAATPDHLLCPRALLLLTLSLRLRLYALVLSIRLVTLWTSASLHVYFVGCAVTVLRRCTGRLLCLRALHTLRFLIDRSMSWYAFTYVTLCYGCYSAYRDLGYIVLYFIRSV